MNLSAIRPASAQKGSLLLTLFVGSLVFYFSFIGLCHLSWSWQSQSLGIMSFGDFSLHKSYLIDGFLALLGFSQGEDYTRFIQHIQQQSAVSSYYIHLVSPLLITAIITLYCGKWLYQSSKSVDLHLRGYQYIQDITQATQQAKQEAQSEFMQDKQKGVHVHPNIQVNRTRENQGFLVIGGMGSGKTQTILPIMLEALQHQHRLVINDDKGEFTQLLPVEDDQMIIIAPWDQRGFVWDIALDISTKGDARDIAAMLIKDSQDPMWSDAARQIFTGVLTYLIHSKGQDWGFSDITDTISLEADALEQTIRDYAPEARRVLSSLKDPDSKTGQSIMITMDAFMAMLYDIAEAWPDIHLARLQNRAFSITQWLQEDYTGAKTLIVQGSEKYKEMRKAFGGAFFTRLIATISDASFPEAKQRETDYRLYFFFDEFPQMGKIESIERLISVCRSKGVRALLGFQDINQVYETYSKETADAWFSQLSTKIICNVAPGNTAKWIAETFDKKEYERANNSGSMSEQEHGGSISLSWEQKENSVLYPSQISTDLGASPKGVIALLACSKWHNIYRLHWPITKLPQKRPAVIPAKWTQIKQNG